jgi:lysozyme family protein
MMADSALRLLDPGIPYTAAFLAAIPFVLEHEGGFVDDPVDAGGATNWGISLRWLKSLGLDDGDVDGDGDIDWHDVRRMTRAQATELYFRKWWQPGPYERLDRPVGAKLFDLAINMGSKPAFRLLQRALRAHGQSVIDDGIIGPRTLTAAQLAAGKHGPESLSSTLGSEAAGFYRELIALKPVREKYRAGWLARAYHQPEL